ncbi:MAG: hypothetical protein JW919_04815 [Candidatus Omnitrophica bacterium]|nr:hypothetical protein [Candidatus Omnitrophota bacterium]
MAVAQRSTYGRYRMNGKFLVISVDTEGDWGAEKKNRITSVDGIKFLGDQCARYGMRPTYLVTYEIVNDEASVRAIREQLDRGMCEVGHHMHIWTTPPFEDPNPYRVDEKWIDGIQSEIPDRPFEQKMRSLHDAVQNNFGVKCVSHRAGRWSVDKRTLSWLEKNGYLVDSSVCPYNSWDATKGVSGRIKTGTYNAPNLPYYPSSGDLAKEAERSDEAFNILEVPVTGIKGDIFSRVKIKGFGRLRSFFNRLGYGGTGDMSFRPSYHLVPLKVFQGLTHDLFGSDTPLVNFMFHSSELSLGSSPFSGTEERLRLVREKIAFVLKTAKEYGVKGITLSESAPYFKR